MTLAFTKSIALWRGSATGAAEGTAEIPAVQVAKPSIRVDVHHDIESMSEHVEEWERLANRVAEPNCFYEHWMLLPALALLRGTEDVRVAFVFRRESHQREEELIGVFPLHLTPAAGAFRRPMVRMWKHDHCYLCTPLIRSDAVADAWQALLSWINTEFSGAMIELPLLAADGDVFESMSEQLAAHRVNHCYRSLYTRAMLELGRSGEWYLQSRQMKSNMKSWSRRRRRLGDIGTVTTRRVTSDIDAALARFLELEASGWKGRGGTALACTPQDKSYFLRTSCAAFHQRRLIMYELLLDGRAIASQVNVIAGEGAFALKVAYDEQYAKFSPGMLLDVEAIHHLHDEAEIRWIDSCTAPGNRAMKRIWQQRRSIAQVLCAPRYSLAGLAVSLLPVVRHLRQMARDVSGRVSVMIGGCVPQELTLVAGCGVI